jgi:spermidine synthase
MPPPGLTVTPLEDGLVLRSRAGDGRVEILAGRVVLLSNAALETEIAFGRLAATLAPPSGPPVRILVGGLGFGATLRGVLEVVPPQARVVVAEKVPAVTRLVAGPLAHVARSPLDDPRATVTHGDVLDVMGQGAPWDAIFLDVDNGPHWASFRTNARLYSQAGLGVARRALAPGGSLAVWSGYPADSFLARLRDAGFRTRCVPLRERGRVRARAYVGSCT